MEQEAKEISNNTSSKKGLVLLEHVEKIVELSANSKLNDEFYTKAAEHIQVISKKLGLSSKQVVLLSVFIDLGDQHTDIGDLAKHFDCRKIHILQELKELEILENLEYIRCYRYKNKQPQYYLANGVIDALQKNEMYTPPSVKNISIEKFFDILDDLFDDKKSDLLTYKKLTAKIDEIFDTNPQLNFVKHINKYELYNDEKILFCYFCVLFVKDNDDNINFYDFEDLYEKNCFRAIKKSLLEQYSGLFLQGLIENAFDNGFSDRESFKLSDFSKKEILSELAINLKSSQSKKDIISHDSIVHKELFYNEKEEKQVKQLAGLLNKIHFDNIRCQLENNGMRKGFACLFHGSPGTGKTETVYQLARMTGRDIFPVNISQIKSMWVGESEKNIKNVFNKYKNHAQNSETIPILLFNEADAVFGVRREGATKAVDKMENSIQNIILEEMEQLDGILIATTNLTQNLDKAFERRFIFKIEFGKPSIKAKQAIWKTMIPILGNEELGSLAEKYDFSGGQIENIARRYTIHNIINNNNPSLYELHELCSSETLCYGSNKKAIGF